VLRALCERESRLCLLRAAHAAHAGVSLLEKMLAQQSMKTSLIATVAAPKKTLANHVHGQLAEPASLRKAPSALPLSFL
jgi:hypothetical protein